MHVVEHDPSAEVCSSHAEDNSSNKGLSNMLKQAK